MIRRAGSQDHIGNLNPIRAFPPMKKKERQIVRPSKLTVTLEACIEMRFSCWNFFGVQRKMTRIECKSDAWFKVGTVSIHCLKGHQLHSSSTSSQVNISCGTSNVDSDAFCFVFCKRPTLSHPSGACISPHVLADFVVNAIATSCTGAKPCSLNNRLCLRPA